MFGLMFEWQTLIFSLIHLRVPLFLHLIVARVDNASLHKYDVENYNKTVKAFLDIEAYSSFFRPLLSNLFSIHAGLSKNKMIDD